MAGVRGIAEANRLWPSRAGHWRKLAIVALSLGLHAVVLGYVGFKAAGPLRQYGEGGLDDPMFPSPPLYLQLEPRPLLRGETARTRATPLPPQHVDRIADAGARLTETPGTRGSADVGDRRRPPEARPAAPEASAPPADVGTLSWTVRPATAGDRIGRGLRASRIGCAAPDLLTATERAACDQRFAERASLARPLGPPPDAERDEAFARQAAANDAWRAYTRDEGPYPGLRSLFTQR